MCHFSGIRKDRTKVPGPGTIPRTVIPVCGTGSLVLGKKTLVSSRYLPQPSYTRVSKWRSNVAVVVSTIAVKRSNRSAALLVEVWRKTNKQTPLTSTSGRGRFGRGSVHLILYFPPSPPNHKQMGSFLKTVAIFPASGRTAPRSRFRVRYPEP